MIWNLKALIILETSWLKHFQIKTLQNKHSNLWLFNSNSILVNVRNYLQYLPYIVTGNSLAVDEPSRCSLDDLKAEVGPGHKFKHHIEHSLAEKSIDINVV